MSVALSHRNSAWTEVASRRFLSLAEKALLAHSLLMPKGYSISTDTMNWKQICWRWMEETQLFEIEFGVTSGGKLDHGFVNAMCDAYGYEVKLMATRVILRPRGKL